MINLCSNEVFRIRIQPVAESGTNPDPNPDKGVLCQIFKKLAIG
jgi:hypothetical protein